VVAAVENLSRLTGTITARTAHPTLDGWDVVTVSVDDVQDVPGKAHLLAALLAGQEAGQPLRVAVRRELLGSAEAGARLHARVRVTANGAIAEPHPDPQDFSVQPAAGPDR
jgi:hypothetical protein